MCAGTGQGSYVALCECGIAFTTTTNKPSVRKSGLAAAVPTSSKKHFCRAARSQSYSVGSPEPPERWTQSGVAQVATGG